jgi:hypothetical protein
MSIPEPAATTDSGSGRAISSTRDAAHLERADELQRAEHKQWCQQQPDDPEQRVQQVGLDQGDPGQGGPQAGEQIAQMLPDGHPQVAV